MSLWPRIIGWWYRGVVLALNDFSQSALTTTEVDENGGQDQNGCPANCDTSYCAG